MEGEVSWTMEPMTLGLELRMVAEICLQMQSCLDLVCLEMMVEIGPEGLMGEQSQKEGVKALEVEYASLGLELMEEEELVLLLLDTRQISSGGDLDREHGFFVWFCLLGDIEGVEVEVDLDLELCWMEVDLRDEVCCVAAVASCCLGGALDGLERAVALAVEAVFGDIVKEKTCKRVVDFLVYFLKLK